MLKQHIILVSLWFLFSALHSLLAFKKWKEKMQAIMKENYRYYRLLYSAFAIINLSVIVIYNFTIQSKMLWQLNLIEKIIAITGILISFSVMALFAKKFFFELSGADVLFKVKASQTLIQTGFYKYVRHPLYTATLIFIWSIFLWQPYVNNLISCVCITTYTIIGITFEEKKLIKDFGDSYIQYKAKTPMLVPKFINVF